MNRRQCLASIGGLLTIPAILLDKSQQEIKDFKIKWVPDVTSLTHGEIKLIYTDGTTETYKFDPDNNRIIDYDPKFDYSNFTLDVTKIDKIEDNIFLKMNHLTIQIGGIQKV